MIFLIIVSTEKSKSSYYSFSYWDKVTHHVVVMEKVAEQPMQQNALKCNTFQVISDLLHKIMNFNALKIFEQIHTKYN